MSELKPIPYEPEFRDWFENYLSVLTPENKETANSMYRVMLDAFQAGALCSLEQLTRMENVRRDDEWPDDDERRIIVGPDEIDHPASGENNEH